MTLLDRHHAKPVGPTGRPITSWSGYPDYQATDADGNVWYAYGPAPRRSRGGT